MDQSYVKSFNQLSEFIGFIFANDKKTDRGRKTREVAKKRIVEIIINKSADYAESFIVVVIAIDAKVARLIVSSRSRVFIVSPILISKLFLTIEWSCALPSPVGQNIFRLFVEIVKRTIRKRSRALFFLLLKPFVSGYQR